MPDDVVTPEVLDTPEQTVAPEIEADDDAVVTPDAPEGDEPQDASEAPEAFSWDSDDSGSDDDAETVVGDDTPETDSKPKAKKVEKVEEQEPDTPDADATDDLEQFLLDEDGDSDPVVAAKLQEANRGITKNFTKFDLWKREQTKQIETKLQQVRERERIADEQEQVMLDAIAGEGIGKADLSKLIQLHPKGKEFAAFLKKQDEYREQLELRAVAADIRAAMMDEGYSSEEVKLWTAKNPKALQDTWDIMVATGKPVHEALRLAGVRSKRNRVNVPRPSEVAAKGGDKTGFTWARS